ncbi:glycosyltransferase family 4 protein [Candidatus Pelagibacter communis]|uniref:glycosyltransferase family 4 protein n=1 Tax=Pelagibacter ubique TaxID=198252 RepID=UPI00094CD324|nr:glycosyltransferase [Candidatus Pelagibacter ubique]
MNILFHCPSKFDLNSIGNSKLGGIETLNLELCKNLSSKYYNIYLSTICKKVIKRKNLTNLPISKLKKENHNYHFDYIVSSNDPNIFNLFRNSKKILWMHNTLAIEKALRKKKLLSILKNKITAVFVSKYLERKTSNLYFFNKKIIIPNFLSNKFIIKKYSYKRKNNFIWSVQREKGLKETLDVWINYIYPKSKKTKLFIFGIDNNKFRKLKNYYKKYNIFFFGRVKKEKLRKVYNQSLAMICLGYDETFCLNAIEANACGLPVITFGKTALKELIKNNYNGLIVKDYKSLSLKMINLMNKKDKIKKKFILNSISNSKKYNFEIIKKKWINLLSK